MERTLSKPPSAVARKEARAVRTTTIASVVLAGLAVGAVVIAMRLRNSPLHMACVGLLLGSASPPLLCLSLRREPSSLSLSLVTAAATALACLLVAADENGDGTVSAEDFVSAAHRLHADLLSLIDVDGNKQVHVTEVLLAATCASFLLFGFHLVQSRSAMIKLRGQYYSEIKGMAEALPAGFRVEFRCNSNGGKPQACYGCANDSTPDESCTFRRSFATGTWVLYAQTGYPLEGLVKYFRGEVKKWRDNAPPGWGGTPSMWRERVGDREQHDSHCPFCVGNEAKILTEETWRVVDEEGRWRLRVVHNGKPLCAPCPSAGEHVVLHHSDAGTCLQSVGVHELVLETPHHNRTLALMDGDGSEVRQVLLAWRERGKAILAQAPRFVSYVQIYKNHGQQAGGSQAHAHSQLVGLPFLPNDIAHRAMLARIYREETGGDSCVYCDELRSAAHGRCIHVSPGGGFVAVAPYVQVAPFHTWLLPRRHSPDFFDTTDAELGDLASLLRTVLHALYELLDDPDYNLYVRTIPAALHPQYAASFHWYIEIMPRIFATDGYQLGTSITKSSVTPEDCAKLLAEKVAPVREHGGT